MAADSTTPLTQSVIIRTWLPLAASWLLMGAELPLLSAVVARLENPDIHLAAYSGIVFPLALVIESPIIMLLTAATALGRDLNAYHKLWRLTNLLGLALTALHMLLAFTPLYDWVARSLIGAPEEIIEPGRIGLQIMTPWTWAIGYRRFHQGVLIRFGHAGAVGWGTAMRLLADVVVLGIGFALHKYSGIVVATSAVAVGVLAEAVYIRWRFQRVLTGPLAEATGPAITMREVVLFYLPIAFAPTIGLLGQPILTGAMSRLDAPTLTLAVWPTLNSLIFMLRAAGIAYTEVVVALLDRPEGRAQLFRFTVLLSVVLSIPLLVLCLTPLIDVWFEKFIGLRPELAAMGKTALWFAVALPAFTTWCCYFEGVLIHHKRSTPVTEAVVFYIVTLFTFLYFTVTAQSQPGLNAAVSAMTLGGLAQMLWLGWRSRGLHTNLTMPQKA